MYHHHQKTRFHSTDELRDIIRDAVEYTHDRRALCVAAQALTGAYFDEEEDEGWQNPVR